MVSTKQLVEAFNTLFLPSFNTRILGGAKEPLYLPATLDCPATIYFRLDYPSSALHEISHWCIAGNERRLLEDYGYWYEPDSRDLLTQQEFERVEVKPQAVECVLHWAAGLPFQISVDNLAFPDYDASHFKHAVMDQVKKNLIFGLPKRAEAFSKYLLTQRRLDAAFDEFIKQQYENNSR